MAGNITIPFSELSNYDLPLLLKHAGSNPDGTATDYDQDTGNLLVTDVEQAALSAALDNYDNYSKTDTEYLAGLRLNNNKKIDVAAGEKRDQYTTTVPGQEMTYITKKGQAMAFIEGGGVSPEQYPFVHADSLAYEITPIEAANQILDTNTAWGVIGAEIERYRLEGKRKINESSDPNEIKFFGNRYVDIIERIGDE